jgi:MFS family permease
VIMKFFSDIRLLLLGIWLGAACFFIGVAQAAFAVLPQHELAGAVVGRTLTILNIAGMAIAAILILSSLAPGKNVNRFWLWIERFLLLLVGAACAVGQFGLGLWLSMVKAQMGKPIDEVAADDPLKIQFDTLHEYSVWVLFAAMAAALITFFIISNRKFGQVKASGTDPYDFSKEFKV